LPIAQTLKRLIEAV